MRVSKSLWLNYTASAVLLLTLVGYPLIAPVSLLLGISNRFVSVPFRALVLFLSLMVIIKGLFLRDRFPSGPFWLAFWIFWGLYICRIVTDGFLDPEVLRLPLSEYLLYAIGTTLLPAAALSIKLDNNVLNRAMIWIIIFGALAAAFNIWMITSHRAIVDVAELTTRRQGSETLNPIILSHLGVTVVILSAWTLVRAETRGLLKQALLMICLFAGAGTALAGASRGPLLILVLTLPLIAFMGIRNLHGKNMLRLFVIIIICLSCLAWALMNIETISAFRRMQDVLFSDSKRMQLYTDGLRLFLNNPLLGAGTEPLGSYPHNVILESFMLFGVFSGFLFVMMIVLSLVAAIRIFFNYQSSSWISLLYVQYIGGSMVSGSLYFSAAMWTIMILSVGQLAVLHSEKHARSCNACNSRQTGAAMNQIS